MVVFCKIILIRAVTVVQKSRSHREKQDMHTQFSWGNLVKRETLEMNITHIKIHLRNTGYKHVNLNKLAHCIHDSKAFGYFTI